MSKLTIIVTNHDMVNNREQKYTVSEMRRRLAQVLSKLSGDQEVSFSFRATLENYEPAPTPKPTIVWGSLARPENN